MNNNIERTQIVVGSIPTMYTPKSEHTAGFWSLFFVNNVYLHECPGGISKTEASKDACSPEPHCKKMTAETITTGLSTLVDHLYLTEAHCIMPLASLLPGSAQQPTHDDTEVEAGWPFWLDSLLSCHGTKLGNYMLAHGEQHFIIILISSQKPSLKELIPLPGMINVESNKHHFLYFKFLSFNKLPWKATLPY